MATAGAHLQRATRTAAGQNGASNTGGCAAHRAAAGSSVSKGVSLLFAAGCYERALYSSEGGQFWDAGTYATAIRLP